MRSITLVILYTLLPRQRTSIYARSSKRKGRARWIALYTSNVARGVVSRRAEGKSIPASIVNLAAGQVSIRLGAKGAEPGDGDGLYDSYRFIERGDADPMIAGGSAAAITR